MLDRQGSRVFAWHSSSEIVLPTPAFEGLRDLVRAGASLRVGQAGAKALEGAPGLLEVETSGSTGTPKIIRRTQASWLRNFEVNGQRFGLGRGDRVCVFGTLAHSLVLYGALEAAHHGARLIGLYGVRPDRQAVAMADHGASVLYITPTQLGLLCAHGSVVASVRVILVGGGALSAQVHESAKTLFPNARIVHFYGAAETSFITWGDADTPIGSVGRAYPGVEIALRDVANGVGEIWVKSPYLFEGYVLGQSGDTSRDGEFLSVGEFGKLDDAGQLFVSGRRSRMVTIADINVFPEEVEAFLAQHVGAGQVVVLDQPDDKRGHHFVAVVAGQARASQDALLGLCRAGLVPIQVPKRIYFAPEIPLLAAGKPDYDALRRWVEEQP